MRDEEKRDGGCNATRSPKQTLNAARLLDLTFHSSISLKFNIASNMHIFKPEMANVTEYTPWKNVGGALNSLCHLQPSPPFQYFFRIFGIYPLLNEPSVLEDAGRPLICYCFGSLALNMKLLKYHHSTTRLLRDINVSVLLKRNDHASSLLPHKKLFFKCYSLKFVGILWEFCLRWASFQETAYHSLSLSN